MWKLGDDDSLDADRGGGPKDRHDAILWRPGYAAFLQKWVQPQAGRLRRGNDGMLHAFNAGYYHPGDDTSASAPASTTEHGWFTTAPCRQLHGCAIGRGVVGIRAL